MSERPSKPKKELKNINKKNEISTSRESKIKGFPIVGIGGSAGSFPSFEKFFNHLPADSGMAFIIILHLDPHHKGQVAELFQNYTPMPVMEAQDGMPVEPDHVYIIPPNKDMGIHNRKLLLLTPAKPNGYRQPIDYFLQSLADDQWNKAVGVILSGMGSDGETGIRMIKEKLGMAMAQDPDSAQYNSMPMAAISTNLVDYVLSPEEMPLKLIQYLNHPVLAEEASEQVRIAIQNTNSIQKILMLLRSQTGHDFSLYKKSTITRRIDRRIAYHQVPDYAAYVNFLRENPLEIEVLFNELLIGVTKFFRDAPAFESLKPKLCALMVNKAGNEPFRVWIAGCSTGEEAYSVAMLLIECLEDMDKGEWPKLQLFATDLDAEAIEHARNGVYFDNIVADVSAARIDKFFIKKDNTFQVKKELREMIVFAQHNLIKDAPFTRLDLLCCRNVMIYLTTELQKKIIPIFHYSLNAGGIMFMGPAETIGGFTEMFISVDPKWKIYERKEGSAQVGRMIDFPFHVAKQYPLNTMKIDDMEKQISKRSVADTFNRILLENFTPSSVLVNEKGDILYSNGKTGKFLELPNGEAVMNIYKMAREELRYVVGNIIHQARLQKGEVAISDIKLKDADAIRLVDLKAILLEETGLQGLVLVIFEDKGYFKKAGGKLKAGDDKTNVAVEELEKELVYTKQQLNSTIEQMETSLEELKSTNEELQSTNEELQSTNEESLTTKEEMQSLNEELMTINMQYQSKAEELTRINNDMKNLLDSTEIGTIFLDNKLDILRYTPQVRKLFNLIPTDVGRPINHVVSNFDNSGIENEIRKVIDTLANKEIEVKTKTDEWYKVRIMPYRTLDNFISGAVLTFTLITGYKQLEYKIEGLQQKFDSISRLYPDALAHIDANNNILWANETFREILKIEEDLQGKPFIPYLEQFIKTEPVLKLLNKAKSGAGVKSADFVLAGSSPGHCTISAIPLKNDEAGSVLLVTLAMKTKGLEK
ncbi:chemotaxis protein CheB [Mucilaginibacter phyllosphaerae]|uniref:protein-glutamate O-methyltransferase n=1 Tax=Mucilaginibacter phyllosphaerae TaxID=1812349 RepID=A0A4Y8AIN6_9SPHI|nr:chemotaxis protein CheB [Mucilaginibacter phyllosphaerae]MBB3968047.1 two-component system CheB/CheR fusion protein [Mucilaginibacter phyllosphaerae]TEW68930.1 chemotaxis protein CheR [Mucilaginibacter phyllosphaerae]GGH01573.1 chemotaxis protein CheR [Mucilaginibacter phyllosphaerae]